MNLIIDLKFPTITNMYSFFPDEGSFDELIKSTYIYSDLQQTIRRLDYPFNDCLYE